MWYVVASRRRCVYRMMRMKHLYPMGPHPHWAHGRRTVRPPPKDGPELAGPLKANLFRRQLGGRTGSLGTGAFARWWVNRSDSLTTRKEDRRASRWWRIRMMCFDLTAWQQEKKTGELPGDGVSGWCVPLVIKAASCQVSCFSSRARLQSFPVMYPGRCKLSWMVFLLIKIGA
jgi:hypothetical protein